MRLRHAKISEFKIRNILRCFCEDLSAATTAKILRLNVNTVERHYTLFREKILLASLEDAQFSGEVEIDESYFGPRRVRGKRGRGASGKTPVFGVMKRKGKVFVTVVKSCTRKELFPVIQGKILEGSTIYSDAWRAYDGLILNGFKHYRIHHNRNEFARGKNHINGIESFWSFAKRRLQKFNGIASHKFPLYLKECEFRFNYRKENLYATLLKILKKS